MFFDQLAGASWGEGIESTRGQHILRSAGSDRLGGKGWRGTMASKGVVKERLLQIISVTAQVAMLKGKLFDYKYLKNLRDASSLQSPSTEQRSRQ